MERLGVIPALVICVAYLVCHHNQLVEPATHAWTASMQRIRIVGSLLPSWSRIDWSSYACVSYATSSDHLCNSVMLAESLYRLGARPDTLILYATDLAADSQANASSARLLQQATQMYGARVQPVAVLNSPSSKLDTMWSQGFTKLLAFNQTRYKRVLSLDSDATLLQPMDELFLLPAESKVAMPRAYWLEDKLCAAVMLASPSGTEFGRIQARLAESQPEGYDMEIINALYGDSCLVFPHKPYLLLTGEMRSKSHEAYLGSKEEPWDVDSVIKQAKYIHFSDYPLPKPWVGASETMKSDLMTSCKASGTKAGGVDCSDREAWLWLYKEFRERRKRVCGPEFADLERVEQYLAELPPMAKGLADAEG
jgi:alpha-N-acetylglucosamine transferase